MEKMLALGVILSAKDMLSPVIGTATKHLSEFEKRSNAIGKSLTKIGTASLAGGVAISSAIGGAYSEYSNLASAHGELESLGIGDKGLGAITKQARRFSNTFAGTVAPDFVKSAYDIKSGIASLSDEAVGEFTYLSSLTAKATKSTAEEMSKLFALGHGIFREDYANDFDFGRKFSAAIGGAVQAFRTDGADLTLGISNIGAAAKAMGVSLEEELSIIGVAKSSFNTAAEAGTGYRAFLNGVGKAQEELGLKFTDSHGKMLPMVEILGKIKDKYGDLSTLKNSDMLKKAFGSSTEAVKLVNALVKKTDELTASQKNLKKKMEQGTESVEEMARAMNNGKEMELFQQRVGNAVAILGSAFAPTINKVGDIIGKVAVKVGAWMQKNEELVSTLGTVVVILGGVLTVLGTFAISVGAVTMALPLLKTGFLALGAAIKIVGGAVMWLGKAFLLNPIGLAVTAIAAAYLIYDNWEGVKTFFSDLWSSITEIFSTSTDKIYTIITAPITLIGKAWSGLFDWFSSKFEWLSGAFGKIKGFASSVVGFFSDDDEESKKVGTAVKDTGIGSQGNATIPPPPKLTYTTLPNGSKNNSVSNHDSTKSMKQTNHINVVVNNPSSNVDIQKAVTGAMSQQGNRSLSDDL